MVGGGEWEIECAVAHFPLEDQKFNHFLSWWTLNFFGKTILVVNKKFKLFLASQLGK